MASPPPRRRTRTETDQRTTHSANSANAAPTNTRQAEPTSPHSASQQPYDEENSDDPRDGCPQPHECSGHGDLESRRSNGRSSPRRVRRRRAGSVDPQLHAYRWVGWSLQQLLSKRAGSSPHPQERLIGTSVRARQESPRRPFDDVPSPSSIQERRQVISGCLRPPQ